MVEEVDGVIEEVDGRVMEGGVCIERVLIDMVYHSKRLFRQDFHKYLIAWTRWCVYRTPRGVARSSSKGVLTRGSTCPPTSCIWDLVMSGTTKPFSSRTVAWVAWDCAYL